MIVGITTNYHFKEDNEAGIARAGTWSGHGSESARCSSTPRMDLPGKMIIIGWPPSS